MSRGRWIGVMLIGLLAIGLAAAQAPAADEPAKPPAQAAMRDSDAGGGRLMLVRSDVVAKDLNLTDEQKESVKKISEEAQKTWEDLRNATTGWAQKHIDAVDHVNAKIDGVLDENQRARLRQIDQQYSITVFPAFLPRIASPLTAEQELKWHDLYREWEAAVGDALDNAVGDLDAARRKFASIGKDYSERRAAVLTPEQREQYDKVLGKRIDLYDAAFPSMLSRHRASKPGPKPDAK